MVDSIGFLNRISYSQVVHRKDVQSGQGKHQEHLGGPNSDSFDLGQFINDCLVVFSGKATQFQLLRIDFFGEVKQIACFLTRDTNLPEIIRGKLQQGIRRELGRFDGLVEPRLDRLCRCP